MADFAPLLNSLKSELTVTKLNPFLIIFVAYSGVPLWIPAKILFFFACSRILKISEKAFEFSGLSNPGFSPIAKLKSAGPI